MRAFESKRQAATLFETLLFLVLLLIGLGVAAYAGGLFGWPGYLFGFLAGSVGAFAVLFISVFLIALVQSMFIGMPWFPACGTGRCKAGLLTDPGDYTFVQFDDQFAVRCRCGLVYVRKKGTRQVLERLPDGTLRPYMLWKPLRGWYADAQKAM